MAQWQMTEDRLELQRSQDINEAQRRQIAYQEAELRRQQAWITRSLELRTPHISPFPPTTSTPRSSCQHAR
jgi:hypothetical protein